MARYFHITVKLSNGDFNYQAQFALKDPLGDCKLRFI